MGTEVDPDLLTNLASKLRNASTELESAASPPPTPEAGRVTGAVNSALALLCEGMGNVSASASGVGDAVAQGRDLYVETDYEQAVNLERQQINADVPPS